MFLLATTFLPALKGPILHPLQSLLPALGQALDLASRHPMGVAIGNLPIETPHWLLLTIDTYVM